MREILSLTMLVMFAGAFAPLPAHTRSRPVSTKFDEYGSIDIEDHMARLDLFAIQLSNQPGSKGYIVVYAPEESAKQISDIAKEYLVNSRGIAPDVIAGVYGGRNDVLSQPRVQLWITPPGARRPRPQKFNPNLQTFRGLFSEKPGWEMDIRQAESAYDKNVLRFPDAAEGELDGPSVTDVTHASLAEVLQQQKTAVAYIVAYNGEESAPGAWRHMAQQNVQWLRDLGIEANRLKTMYGGNQKESKVQLWVTPGDAPAPVPNAEPEQLPRKAVSLGWLSDSELGYTGVERNALNRIVSTLQQFPTLRARIVVTFGTYEEPLEEAAPQRIVEEKTTEPDESPAAKGEPEPEPADVAKLVEKWKEELLQKYKIGADRFVVLFSRTDSFSNNMVEMFVVPPGSALPNPDAESHEQSTAAKQPMNHSPSANTTQLN